MSNDTLLVLVGDDIAGTLTRLPNRRLRFDYDAAYRARPRATPLSLSMPTQVAAHPDGVVTPWLWGLLPENPAVLTRWARQFEASSSSPFSLLATPVGEDCAGAVRFCRPDRLEAAVARKGRVRWLADGEVAERLRDLAEDATAWLGDRFTGQFSLAGAQAKTALLHEEGRWGVPAGRIPTTHILKPAITGLDDHDLNEHLCLAAARRAGLAAAHTRVGRFADQTAIVVERYDRRRAGEEVVRVHQEDVAQALGIHPSRKYEADGGPGARDVVELFRRAMSARVAQDTTARFVDALAWNWLIGGTDAHAKNYSLLLAGPEVRLAPLYDVASALPYEREVAKLRLAMKLGGEYRCKAHRANSWERAARELGLAPEEVCGRVLALAERAPDAFRDAAATPDVVALASTLPARLVDAVAARATECSKLLRNR